MCWCAGLCSCLVCCLVWGVQHWELLAVGWSQVLDSNRGLHESLRQLIFSGAGNSLVIQRPGLSAPTPEPQAWLLVKGPRPHNSLILAKRGIKKKKKMTNKIPYKWWKVKSNKQKQGNTHTHTHTKETKTEPNKSKSKRTTKQKNPRTKSNN